MPCPSCGRSAGTFAGLCAACGAAVPASAFNGTIGVLTPPPGATGISAPHPSTGTLTFGAEVTRLIANGDAGGAAAPIAEGRHLADRYHIIRLIGVGGMGVVYQAWDEKLGVSVALKVILPPGADNPAAVADLERRFKTELLLARQVTHKNVVRIHDLGENVRQVRRFFRRRSPLPNRSRLRRQCPNPRRSAWSSQVSFWRFGRGSLQVGSLKSEV